jgi:hypothetical protein
MGGMFLTEGTLPSAMAHSPFAHVNQASFVSTPGAHAVEDVMENLTPAIDHNLHRTQQTFGFRPSPE